MIREILTNRGFSDTEIGALETREDYEAVKLKIEQLQADSLLNELEARAIEGVETQALDLETRWESFKAAITALEWWEPGTSDTETTQETLDEMKTRLETEAIEAAETAFREQAEKRWFFAGMFVDYIIDAQRDMRENPDKFKWFGGALAKLWIAIALAFSGGKEIFEDLTGKIESARNAELPVPTIPTEIVPPVLGTEEPIQWEDLAWVDLDLEAWVENLNIDNFRYNTWLETMIFFSDGRNIEWNDFIRNKIFDGIKGLSLNEVRELQWDTSKQEALFWSEDMELDGFEEGLWIILDSVKSEAFTNVCELSLDWGRISSILTPNENENTHLFEILGPERAREINNESQQVWFDIKDLTMYELSILYSASFPNFAYLQLAWGFSSWVNTLNTASEDFIELAENSLAWKVASLEASVWSGWLIDNDSEFTSSMQDRYPDMPISTIEGIIWFKNKIKSPDFQNNPSLKMTPEMQAAFDKNLTYTKIMILHDIMGWWEIEDINSLNFPLLILAIWSIIGWWVGDNLDNSRLESQYKSLFLWEWGINFFFRDDLTDNERRAIEIYGENFAQLWVIKTLENLYATAGIADAVIWSIPEEHWLIWSWLTTLAWRRMLQSWYTRWSLVRIGSWKLVMRAGWVWVLIYWAILGRDILSGDSEEDIEEIPTDEEWVYIGQVLERDLEAATSIWEQEDVIHRLESSVRTHSVWGETMTIITYPWDIPHVVYMGKIWTFDVLDSRDIAWDLEWHLINFIQRWTDEEIPLDSDSVWSDGTNIFVGESAQSSFQFTFTEVFTDNNMAMGVNTARDLQWGLRALLDEQFPWHWYEWTWDLWDYITLLPIPGEENKYLSLVAAPGWNTEIPTS